MTNLKQILKKIQTLNKEKEYSKVVELLPESVLSKYNNSELYSELAQALYRLKKNNESYLAAEKSLVLNLQNAKARHYKGNWLLDNDKYQEAEKEYKKAIEIDPKLSLPYLGLGNVYFELKEYEQAKNNYQKSINIEPNEAIGYNGLAEAYTASYEYEKAIECCNNSIIIDPKSDYPYSQLGNIYYKLGKYKKAKSYFLKALTLNKKSAYDLNYIGICFHALKDNKKAIEFYSKALRADTNFISATYNRAMAYFEIEEYSKSLADYENYLLLSSDSSDYYISWAKSRIAEIKRLISSTDYSRISELVFKIKNLLLFKDGCITHYTSLSVAKALILDKSQLRLSEGAYLNDTSEGMELFKFLSLHITNLNNNTVAEPFTQKPFIGSFVTETKHDDLTLWRMYGKEDKEEAKGCAITIDMSKLLDNLRNKLIPKDKGATSSNSGEEFNFYRVAYRKASMHDTFIIPGASEEEEKELNNCMYDLLSYVREFVSSQSFEASNKKNLATLLNEIAYLFKSAEYQYEHELRLVVKGTGMNKFISRDFHPPKVYIQLIDISSIIKKITLGPKVEKADEWAAAFYYTLDKEELHPEILISHLPFK